MSASALPSLDQAREAMLATLRPLAPSVATLDEAALGRILAEDLTAAFDQPPFDQSAMDGYAIRRPEGADGRGEIRLRVVGEARAGDPPAALARDCAFRIFTGAPMPEGAVSVVPQERARRDGDFVVLSPPGQDDQRDNLRRRGGDFRAGDRLLAAGSRLDPWRLSLAAAGGFAHARLAAQPRVAVLSTGSELVPAGTIRAAHQIHDSNGPAAAALVVWWGGRLAARLHAPDDEAAIAATLRPINAELIVVLGGASVGNYDLVKPALRRLGLQLTFERVRIRPGKPAWFGVLDDGRPVLGLPGNPSAAMVAAELLLKPALRYLQGLPAVTKYRMLRLAGVLPGWNAEKGSGASSDAWERFYRARLGLEPDGGWVTPFDDQDSGRVRVFSEADALIRVPAGVTAPEPGARVEVLMLERAP